MIIVMTAPDRDRIDLQTNFKHDNLIWNKKAFPNRIDSSEDIVLIVREDVIIIGFRALGYLLFLGVLVVGRVFLSGVPTASFLFLYDLFLYGISLILILFFAYNFHNYYLSLQIVTDRRLIDIDQRGLFNREVNELALSNVEDVSYKQSGIWGAVFNFGTVSVQTAAEVSTTTSKSNAISDGFVFQNVPAPAEVHAIISEMFHKSKDDEAHYNARIQAEYMANMVKNNNGQSAFTNMPPTTFSTPVPSDNITLKDEN